MAKRSYTPNAQQRILETARNVFAEKGFDGARVDEIAKEAGVPKSLIYYHFPSKEAILEELMNACLAEYQAILHQFFHDPVDFEPEVLLRHVQSGYLKFLETNEDVIRIISMEALKKNSPAAKLTFKFVESLMRVEEQRLPKLRDLDAQQRMHRMVMEFFASFVPITIFFCFRDAWNEHFKTDSETLTQHFLRVYDATYGAYRRQQDR